MPILTQAPDPNPKTPKLALPPGSCDTHIHLFGPADEYPFAPDSPYTSRDALAETNIALQRAFRLPILGDAGKLELRGEFINAFNRVNLGGPVGDLSSTMFGKSTSQYSPRQIQLVGHIRF